jgi:hypothetical protein
MATALKKHVPRMLELLRELIESKPEYYIFSLPQIHDHILKNYRYKYVSRIALACLFKRLKQYKIYKNVGTRSHRSYIFIRV